MKGKVRKLGLAILMAVLVLALPCAGVSAATKKSTAKKTATTTTVKKKVKNGWVTKKGKTYYYKKGKMVTGWRTIKKKKYYFITSGKQKGQMVTGWKIMNKNYYYFNADGSLNTKKSINSSRKSDKTGTAKAKTLRRAKAIVEMITTPKMSKSQKLKVCFNYVMKYTGRRPRTPHSRAMDWPVVYANDMFLDGSGNCFSYAAAYGFLAKACGYKNVYCCNSTGHGWTEINGKIYDPEEYRNTRYKYYGTSYNSVPGYRRAIAAQKSYPFMHVKI